jgi:hypothetical protein
MMAVLGGALILPGAGIVHAQQGMTKEQLVGTWHLVSFKSTSGDQVSDPLGEHPGGFVGFSVLQRQKERRKQREDSCRTPA